MQQCVVRKCHFRQYQWYITCKSLTCQFAVLVVEVSDLPMAVR